MSGIRDVAEQAQTLRRRLRLRIRRWMLRSRAPETQPVKLRQSRVYVLPTKAGLAMAATLLVMLLASINYNLSLGYALCFVLGGVWVAHILESWRGLVDLEITLHPVGEAFAAGTAGFEASLTSRSSRPRHVITLRDDNGRELLSANLAAQGSSRERFEMPSPRRGRQPVGQITIECLQPLGWIRAWAYIEPAVEQLVFPQPFGKPELPFSSGYNATSAAAQIHGDDDFAGLRNYQPADSPRHLAWKNHARGQPLQSKVFTGNQSPEVVLDWFALPPQQTPETRLSQLTLWVLAARQHSVRTTLILPRETIGAGQDTMHHHRCLTRLALFNLEAAT